MDDASIRTEADARAAGFSREVTATSSGPQLNLLVKPNDDYDEVFAAFCLDEQEMLSVNGWLFTLDDV